MTVDIRGELWTVAQTAEELGEPLETVKQWIKRRQLARAAERPLRVWSDDAYDCQHARRQPQPRHAESGKFVSRV